MPEVTADAATKLKEFLIQVLGASAGILQELCILLTPRKKQTLD